MSKRARRIDGKSITTKSNIDGLDGEFDRIELEQRNIPYSPFKFPFQEKSVGSDSDSDTVLVGDDIVGLPIQFQ
jgi:hypothetical protein